MTAETTDPTSRTWPACATYPNLECVCRGALGQNKATCTRKRTGDLTPLRRVTPDTTDPTADEHDCTTCSDCIHNGNRCCGCYDGACCKTEAFRGLGGSATRERFARAVLASPWLAAHVSAAETKARGDERERIARAIEAGRTSRPVGVSPTEHAASIARGDAR